MVQEVTPALQEVGLVVQVRLGVQDEHTPALQNRFELAVGPHAVPFASTTLLSTQRATPVAQESLPWWQALVGLQSPPSAHATQAPALQTIPLDPAGEQFVPAGLSPFSTHTEVPVAQEVAPVLHGLDGWQATFGVHETHIPDRHTRLVPHTPAVPSAKATLVSVHTAAPVLQTSVP